MRRVLLFGIALLCVASARAQTPGLYSHNDESLTWAQTTTGSNVKNFVLSIEPATISGNTVIVNLMLGSSTLPTGLTVTDNGSGGSNTYTLVNSEQDTTDGNYLFQFCGVQTHSASLFTITATTDLGTPWGKGSVTQYYNLSCTSDQTWGNNPAGTSATWSCGSAAKSTSTANDVIHTFMVEKTASTFTAEPSFTASSGSQLVDGSGQIWDLLPQSWGVFAAGSYNPSITVPSAAHYLSACVALKPTSSGSAPPATPYVRAVMHGAVACIGSLGPCNETGSTIKWQMPTSVGSLIVLLFTGGNTTDYATSATSSVSGETVALSTACAFHQTGSGGSGSTQIAYILNAGASQSRIITFTPSATPISDDTYIFVEVANAASATCDTGAQGTGTQNTTGASITYTAGSFGETNPIVLSVLAVNNGGVATSAPVSGVNYLHGSYTANVSGTAEMQCPTLLTPPNMIDECNAFYSSFPASASSFTITAPISISGEAFGPYAWAWASFNPNSGGGTTIVPALPLLGTGVGD